MSKPFLRDLYIYEVNVSIWEIYEKLKEYVQNKVRLKGFIAEGYVVDETLIFYLMYLEGIETKFNRPEIKSDIDKLKNELSNFSISVSSYRKNESHSA